MPFIYPMFSVVFVLLALWPNSTWAKELAISHQWTALVDARDRAARVFVHEVEARLPDVRFQIHPQLALKFKAEEQTTESLLLEVVQTLMDEATTK